MDISPYLAALGRCYRLKKLDEVPHLRLWEARKRGLFGREIFFLGYSDLFYLPENEHILRGAVAKAHLPIRHPWQTRKVLVLCSYNGMQDLRGDDLRSFTENALINYLLLQRQEGIWIGEDTFFRGGSSLPRQVREMLQGVTAQLLQES